MKGAGKAGRIALSAVFIPASLLWICIAGAGGFWASALLRPLSPDRDAFPYIESARILDKEGRVLREAVDASGVRARWTDLADVSPWAMEAAIAAEDERFRVHPGVDPLAALRALLLNAAPIRLPRSGASTITMQLARILLGHPHDIPGKLRQAWDAIRLERAHGKDWVMEQYLNRAPFGGNCVGIGAASERYFGKPPSHLSLSEAAFLMGLPQSPTTLDPLRFPEAAEARRRYVLSRIRKTGAASGADIERAVAEIPLPSDYSPEVRAGHFTDYVLSLGRKEGSIPTTLDAELNDAAAALVREHVSRLDRNFLSNAAVIILDNRDASIIAMVGSRDWNDEDAGAVNGATARRQPGSALKPFLYSLAFERGWNPASILADVESEYYGTDRTLYIPQNYSLAFRGPVTAKEALALSLNVPAIRLASAVGLTNFLERLRDLGFAGLTGESGHYGLGLALGNGEVSLLELAGAYSTLARGGLRIAPSPFPEPGRTAVRVLGERAAWLATSILADERMRVQAFGPSNPLILGFPLAVKTGTSNEWRDAWAIGYTERYTIAVWAGNFSARPMDRVSGTAGAGTLLARVASVLRSRDPRGFALPPEPRGVKSATVCAESGGRPGPHCGRLMSLYLPEEKELAPCGVHRLVKVDSRTGRIAAPDCPAKYVKEKVARYLPPEYDGWLRSAGYGPPPSADAAPLDAVAIKKPRNGDVFIIEPGYDRRTQSVELMAEAPSGAGGRMEWIIDGKTVASAEWPYNADWPLEEGEHVLVARLRGVKGVSSSEPLRFTVR